MVRVPSPTFQIRSLSPGYDGVHIFAPDGTRIGQIRLPEICSNVCFGGSKRNRAQLRHAKAMEANIHVYLSALATCSACARCSRNRVKPVCNRDFSSPFLADGIRVDSSAPSTVL